MQGQLNAFKQSDSAGYNKALGDPKYVDVIVKRWEKQTSKQAVLEANGRTFEEIAAERLAVAI